MAIKGTCRCSHPAWSWSPEAITNFMFNHQFPHQNCQKLIGVTLLADTPTLWLSDIAEILVLEKQPTSLCELIPDIHTHKSYCWLQYAFLLISHVSSPWSHNPHQKPPCLVAYQLLQSPQKKESANGDLSTIPQWPKKESHLWWGFAAQISHRASGIITPFLEI